MAKIQVALGNIRSLSRELVRAYIKDVCSGMYPFGITILDAGQIQALQSDAEN